MQGHFLNRKILIRYFAAGLVSSGLQTALMAIKYRLHFLPNFRPYEAIQAQLLENFGYLLPTSWLWLFSFVNGALLIGALFGTLYSRLTKIPVWAKGLSIGFSAWVIVMTIVFPALDYGVFGIASGFGLEPALFALVMIITYSVAYGFAYERI